MPSFIASGLSIDGKVERHVSRRTRCRNVLANRKVVEPILDDRNLVISGERWVSWSRIGSNCRISGCHSGWFEGRREYFNDFVLCQHQNTNYMHCLQHIRWLATTNNYFWANAELHIRYAFSCGPKAILMTQIRVSLRDGKKDNCVAMTSFCKSPFFRLPELEEAKSKTSSDSYMWVLKGCLSRACSEKTQCNSRSLSTFYCA